VATFPGFVPTFIQRFGERHGLRNPPRSGTLVATWDEITALFEWCDAGIEGFGPKFAKHFVAHFPMAGWLRAFVSTPAGLQRAALYAWKRVWPMVEFETEELRNGLVLTCALREGFRACEVFFRLMAEVHRELPVGIGCERNQVVASISPTGGQYLVTYGATAAANGRAEYAPEVIFGSLMKLGVSLSPRTVPPQWRLTESEARLVLELVEGASLRNAAKSLGVEYETARSHLKRAMSKAGVNRQVELVSAVLGLR